MKPSSIFKFPVNQFLFALLVAICLVNCESYGLKEYDTPELPLIDQLEGNWRVTSISNGLEVRELVDGQLTFDFTKSNNSEGSLMTTSILPDQRVCTTSCSIIALQKSFSLISCSSAACSDISPDTSIEVEEVSNTRLRLRVERSLENETQVTVFQAEKRR
ncbi:MAG: hypothetical protein AAFO07_10820 [Bacteroidota bacterium]